MLTIRNLNKKFQNQVVLNNISFHINKGEIGIIVGKSGAGKSTLLRCITGLEPIDSGEIFVNNQAMTEQKKSNFMAKQIGYVFQNNQLFPHLTVLENLTIAPVYNLKISKKLAIEKATRLLSLVDLTDKANMYPCELSGGQCQRVAIARACMLEPNLLCIDEPTSALDLENIDRLLKILRTLKDNQITLLIITHDLQFASKIADCILTLDEGTLTY